MQEYNMKEGQYVHFNMGENGPKGFGWVRGISSTSLPIMGCMYIVQMESPRNAGIDVEKYGYSHIVVPENCLEMKNPITVGEY